jgi:uncharacterized protein (TIGR03435 family)
MRALLLLATASALIAQQPEFEVASIKPSPDSSSNNSTGNSGSGRLLMSNVTLKRAVMGAYRLGKNEVVGGPDWFDSDRWVIQAKADHPAGDSEMMQMLQTLLAERFQLKTHRENRPMNAFILEVAKGGHKLKLSTAEGARTGNSRGGLDAQHMTMVRFAEVLARQTDLPVVDRTGLDGAYDFKLEWTLDADRPAKDGPALPTALQEQLGLRLRAEKVPIEVLVIDSASRPSAN